MKKVARILKAASVIVVITAMAAAGSALAAQARQGLDHKDMVEELGALFKEALSLYRKGDVQEAKTRIESAYLEVFENLEGPIRTNVSARKNYELEQEFIAIRKMIVAKEPAEAIEKRVDAFMAELRSVTARLHGGFELVAEAPDDAGPQGDGGVTAGARNIEPFWLQSLENIHAGLDRALDVYRKGDAGGAAEIAIRTQLDNYRNGLFDTAVRRHISQSRNFENNSAFGQISSMMQRGEPPEKVEMQIAGLMKGLRQALPGLPLVDGAVSEREAAAPAESDMPARDWKKVTAEMFARIDKAIALYRKDEKKEAGRLIREVYFDVFEASGMEAQIGARDPNFKAELEGRFAKITGLVKTGAPVETLEDALAGMKRDFDKAAEMLGKGKDSPRALFFYSLMIILREGIEAILIITAIIAYLIKTGNSARVKVIYNGCISAVVLSIITALVVRWLFNVSAASQEAMEGGTMLLASVVLFSVSYWLISKAEAQRWVSYIKNRVGDSLSANSLRALWFAAFMAVYREGAETVLFYRALVSGSSASGITAAAAGFAVGCALLAGVYLAMRYGVARLPIKPFFLFTGALMYYMAFVFAGQGMMELIEGKVFEGSLLPWAPRLPLIGLYPYVQSMVPQFVIVLAAIVGLVLMARRRGPGMEDIKQEESR